MKKLTSLGKDPDPRFTLANERTFLAWVRTSMALILAESRQSVANLRTG